MRMQSSRTSTNETSSVCCVSVPPHLEEQQHWHFTVHSKTVIPTTMAKLSCNTIGLYCNVDFVYKDPFRDQTMTNHIRLHSPVLLNLVYFVINFPLLKKIHFLAIRLRHVRHHVFCVKCLMNEFYYSCLIQLALKILFDKTECWIVSKH